MSNENGLTPELRFSEFQNLPIWERKPLGSFAVLQKGKGLSKGEIVPNGKYKCIHYGELFTTYSEVIESVISYTNTVSTSFSKTNDVLMPTSDVTPNGLAKACCIKLDNVILGGDILIIRTDSSEINGEFLCRLIRHNERNVLKLVSGSTVYHLYGSALEKLTLTIPITLKEQQKIADCFSSLDDIITAQTQKLDFLKAHKKGLMQDLFPAEGESVPRLRFREFEGDGDWAEKNLIDLALNGFSNGVFNDPKKVGAGYKLINVGDMYLETTIDENRLLLIGIEKSEFNKNKVEYGDIFFTRSSLVAAGIAKSNIYLGNALDVTFDGHLIRLRPITEIVYPIFLYYLLQTSHIRSQLIAKGKTATMTTIGQADIASVNLKLPSTKEEQQKIANCLSSLDEQIQAQTQKINALKLHKKGLMQQLFPNTNELP